MSIKINQVELSSDLAVRELNERFERQPHLFPNGVIKDPHAECTEYTEEAQDEFNKLYDDYWDLIGSREEK